MSLLAVVLLIALTVILIVHWKKTGATWALVLGSIVGTFAVGYTLLVGYIILALMFAFG